MSDDRNVDFLTAFARSLTVAGLGRTLLLVGLVLLGLSLVRLWPMHDASPASWLRLAGALGFSSIAGAVLATSRWRRRDWRARGLAPVGVMLATMVVGPLFVAARHDGRDLVDLVETMLSGPTLGLCVMLDALLLKESVVTRDDLG